MTETRMQIQELETRISDALGEPDPKMANAAEEVLQCVEDGDPVAVSEVALALGAGGLESTMKRRDDAKRFYQIALPTSDDPYMERIYGDVDQWLQEHPDVSVKDGVLMLPREWERSVDCSTTLYGQNGEIFIEVLSIPDFWDPFYKVTLYTR